MANYATLILDKPLVNEKIRVQLAPGSKLTEFLASIEIKPGFAFVVLVNGLVSESDIIVQSGDEIRCLPQITGGML